MDLNGTEGAEVKKKTKKQTTLCNEYVRRWEGDLQHQDTVTVVKVE